MTNPPSRPTLRRLLPLVAVCWSIGLASAQESPQDAFPTPKESVEGADEGTPLLQIRRIELSAFGGLLGGATWLELPQIEDEQLTSDRGASRILDFSGNPVPELKAPQKEFESGWTLGGSASFYIGANFGVQLAGSYGKMDAVLTGYDPVAKSRFEADRLSVDILRGSGSMIYNVGRESKLLVRPFFTLGFGGILLKELGLSSNLPDESSAPQPTGNDDVSQSRDVTALFFQYGLGVSAPLYGSFRAEIGANFSLYTFETDEVALDSTIQFPAAYIGIAWRYEVDEDAQPHNEKIEDYD